MRDTNGRSFVFYTRPAGGTLVIAEYARSGNPDVASTTEKVILTIPHPTFTNHNGGMLACSGSLTVTPAATTTYTLTSQTASGTLHPALSVTVTVTSP